MCHRPVPDASSGALLMALDANARGESLDSPAAMALVARRDLAAGAVVWVLLGRPAPGELLLSRGAQGRR